MEITTRKHLVSYTESGDNHSAVCRCGWKSPSYAASPDYNVTQVLRDEARAHRVGVEIRDGWYS